MAERTLIRMERVSKRLPTGGDLLTDVNLSVAAASSLAILGRSGSGKSTLLGLLGLMDRLDAGRYLLDGIPMENARTKRIDAARGRTLGFVFQRFCLIPHLTTLENVEAPLLHAPGISRSTRRRRARQLIERVGLGDHLNKRPHQLSGGEQQRVAIARALVTQPKVVLADEPTGALDTTTADIVLDLLFEQTKLRGAALIMVTHDPLIAARAASVRHLRGGVLQEEQVLQ